MLNFEKKGRPLCIIEGGQYDGSKIYCDPDGKAKHGFNTFKLPSSYKGKLQHIPDTTTERSCGYIAGKSGSGKSYYVRNYCIQWLKKHKDRPIYIFSKLNSDESLDSIKPKPLRVKIDDSLITNPINVEDLKDSLCIFDDIDVIPEKKLRAAVISVLDQALEVGRHFAIDILMTNHLVSNGKDTRRVLNECHFAVIFPHGSSAHSLRYLCEKYLGLTNEDLKRLKKIKSRAITIFNSYPTVIMGEKEIYTLSSMNGDENDSDSNNSDSD